MTDLEMQAQWFAEHRPLLCRRFNVRLTWEKCQEYRQRRAGCDGVEVSRCVKAARARAEKRKQYKACRICGSQAKKLNRWGYCNACNFRRFGGGV